MERGLGWLILLFRRLNVCLTCMSLAFDVWVKSYFYSTRLPLLSKHFFKP